jgi:hypothetical protein
MGPGHGAIVDGMDLIKQGGKVKHLNHVKKIYRIHKIVNNNHTYE